MKLAGRESSSCFNCRRKRRRCDRRSAGCAICLKAGTHCVYLKQPPGSRFIILQGPDRASSLSGTIASLTFLNTTPEDLEALWTPLPQYLGNSSTGQQYLPRMEVGGEETRDENISTSCIFYNYRDHEQPALIRQPRRSQVHQASQGLDETESSLFHYYREVISKTWAYDPSDSNVFHDTILPEAISTTASPLLLTILALSSAEWGRSLRPDSEKYYRLSLSYKVQALQDMQPLLNHPQLANYNSLTCVLLSSLEIITGEEGWNQHLNGLFALLHNFGDQIDSSVKDFALQYFHTRYILSMTATLPREGNKASQGALGDLMASPDLINRLELLMVDRYIGCPHKLLRIIAQISRISSTDLDDSGVDIYVRLSMDQLQSLDHEIISCNLHEMTELSPGLRKSIEAFQIAARIYLRLVCLNSSGADAFIMENLSLLLQILASIITGSERRLFPMWPLFVAGCACLNEEQRAAVMDLFEKLHLHWPTENVRVAWKAVGEIWQWKDHVGSSRGRAIRHGDWTMLLKKGGRKLSLV